ncbi:MAG: aspartate aminotransferase family protein, partial [Acidobacteriota bacterium]
GAHRAAMGQHAAYLMRGVGEQRDGMEWTPEASRRARVAPLYVDLRTMGRRGVGELVSRCCALALRMAARLRPHEGIEILNDVVLNQVLVRVRAGAANITPEVLSTVQQGGVCWVGGTSWQGEPAMRISISGWPTSEGDVDRSAEAILAAARAGAR